jgi:hypothetical protein
MSAQHEQSMPGPKSKQTRRLRSGSAPRRRAPPGPSDWPRRLVEQAASASRATRLLLLREGATGPFIVASQLPPGEDGAALHGAITPWLDEARRTRHARLRHGPVGAAARRSVRASSRRWSATACSASSMPTSTAQPDASAAPIATCSRRSPTRRRSR